MFAVPVDDVVGATAEQSDGAPEHDRYRIAPSVPHDLDSIDPRLTGWKRCQPLRAPLRRAFFEGFVERPKRGRTLWVVRGCVALAAETFGSGIGFNDEEVTSSTSPWSRPFRRTTNSGRAHLQSTATKPSNGTHQPKSRGFCGAAKSSCVPAQPGK